MADSFPATQPSMTETFDPASATIAIVTYNRSALLSKLLASIVRMDPHPGHVVVIDNASVDDTAKVVESFREQIPATIVYRRLETNTGGSGGFSEGMRVAYELGSTWMWLMDDDVEVLPDGLARMGAWAPRFKSIQGRRYDYDGSEFYWQYRLSIPLGIPIPFAPAGFDEARYREMNSGCFEGMFIHREIRQWDMGVRHLNASSNAYRYYIMRNRGHMRHYFQTHGAHRPIRFAVGTFLTFAKELIRLVFVERTVRGTSNLWRGLRDGRRIARDDSWRPMAPLEASTN